MARLGQRADGCYLESSRKQAPSYSELGIIKFKDVRLRGGLGTMEEESFYFFYLFFGWNPGPLTCQASTPPLGRTVLAWSQDLCLFFSIPKMIGVCLCVHGCTGPSLQLQICLF